MGKKKWKLVGPGKLLDRKVHKGILDVGFDPSPDGFISDSTSRNERLTVTIIPEDGHIEPIVCEAAAGTWKFKLESTSVPRERVADLDSLVSGEKPVTIIMEYERQEDLIEDAERRQSEEEFSEDQIPGGGTGVNPSAGTPDAYNIIIKGAKKIGLSGSIVLSRASEPDDGWLGDYHIEAGRNTLQRDDLLRASEVFTTSAQAADAMCTEIVQRLEKMTEAEYKFAGAAASRVKQAVKKWLDTADER